MINPAETLPPQTQSGAAINNSETVLPGSMAQGGSRVNAAVTIPPGAVSQSGQSAVLLAGESISDSYVIHSLMDNQGKQSNVYLAKKWGKSYVVKIYHNGWHPSARMQSFLTGVRHPNIANVVECGTHEGNYYEIYDYYSEGTLEETGALSPTHIQNVVVPCINEGLHELHRNGIVHCDIKPSNLFYADNGRRVVIGDCGISGYTNSNGKLVDAIRGTPEYAPRVKALLWSAAMSPAYDYGSFGLVLCRLVLGHSLFEGMSVEEISNAWEAGITLPSRISGRLSNLIKGLINEDEDQRWGYAQVKRWCEGEFIRPVKRNIYGRTKTQKQIKPLIFGRFDGQILSVNSIRQLEMAIRSHWTQAAHIIKRRELVEFVRQFEDSLPDKTLPDKIRKLALYQDTDAAVFKLLMYIQDDPTQICYCGREYSSPQELVGQLSAGMDESVKKFIISGMLVFYLRFNGYDQVQVDRLEQIIRRSGGGDTAAISTICFALQGKNDIDVFGVNVDSLDALIPVLSRCSIREIDELLRDDSFNAWLNRLGYEKEVRRMKEAF